MKRELLLSTLILTSPIAQISMAQATEIRASIIEQVQRGKEQNLISKKHIAVTHEGETLKVRVKLHLPTDDVQEPNMVKPELSGDVELVKDDGTVVSTMGSEDEGFIFDLIHSDDYSDKYVGYGCSSTLRCDATAGVFLEFIKDENLMTISFPTPEGLKPILNSGTSYIELETLNR